jgi:hypothetical protein
VLRTSLGARARYASGSCSTSSMNRCEVLRTRC